MAKPHWEQTWTIEAGTDSTKGGVFDENGKARIKLTAQHLHGKHGKITVYLAEPVDAPATWRDVVLIPRGSKDVPDTFQFNPPPDPGAMSPETAGQYLSQAEVIWDNASQDVNNLRLEGDLRTDGDSIAVALYLVQRANEPKHWYLVVRVQQPDNPDGGGVDHH